jgi:tetratricopeptide (TPR) repeat protein
VDAYERALRSISSTEPRDIDAWAHLGNLYLDMADPAGLTVVFPLEPSRTDRRAWLRKALAYYQTGVAVGELALPDPFTGLLVWGQLDNRPFLRALHGLSLALWRLGRFDEAELALLNMLWLNPMDNQGARGLLPYARGRLRWEGDSDESPARSTTTLL